MMRRLLILCGCAWLAPALAGGAAVQDIPAAYAWALPVTVADDNGVHAMRMPAAVYLHAQSAGLADIRLFDRRGLPVPYALRQPPTDTYTDARALPLRIFPLYRQDGAPTSATVQGDFKLELRTDSDGRLLSVTSGGPSTSAQPVSRGAALETLILDLGVAARATPPTVTALRFTPPAGKPGYTAQVWLEASDDMRTWRPLGAADLQWLSATDGAVLACDVLAFEPAQFRYARLTWRGGTPALFAGVTALSVNQRRRAPAMDSILLTPAPGRVPGDLVYAAGIGIPAEQAGLQFTAQNAVYAAMLGRYREAPPIVPPVARQERRHQHGHLHHHLRERLHLHRHHAGYLYPPVQVTPQDELPQDPFIPIASATFYDITQDGRRKRSGGLPLPATQLAQWVVRPYSPQTAALPLSEAPKLQLSWTPATLLFLANGHGPYTLSFGRAGAPRMEHDLGHIAPGYSEQELRALPQAEAGTARPAAGAAQAAAIAASIGAARTGGMVGQAGSAGPGASPALAGPAGSPGGAGAAGAGGTGVGTAGAGAAGPNAGNSAMGANDPATATAAGATGAAANSNTGAGANATPAPSQSPRSTAQGASRAAGKIVEMSDNGLLWTVLLAGVGALAYFTVRLMKQPGANGS